MAGILISVFPSIFQHPFVTQPLNRSLAIELLDKMNNPDHSTYHDFDDDDPEVGIASNHRIRLSFCLPAKLNYCDLLSPSTFCDLGIVSGVAFTFSCAALSLIQALGKNNYIFGKGRLRKKRLYCFKIVEEQQWTKLWSIYVIRFSSPEFCHAFCSYVSLWSYDSICKEDFHKTDSLSCVKENDPVVDFVQ